MCEYCEHENTIWYDDATDYDGDGFIITISPNNAPCIFIDTYMDSGCMHDYIAIPIGYCPVCGRKLDEETTSEE